MTWKVLAAPARLVGAAAALLLAAVANPAAAAPGAAAFGHLPTVQSASISPDGEAVALVSGTPHQRMLSIATIDKPDPVLIDLGDVRTSYVRWAGDGHIFVNVTKYEKPSWSKYSYNFTRDLIFDREGALKGWVLSNSPESGLLSGIPILMMNMTAEKPFAVVQGRDITGSTLWKVDVSTGRGSIITHERAGDWALDLSGDERAKIDWTGSGWVIAMRRKGQTSWKVVATERDEERQLNLLGYSEPEDAVYWWQEDGPAGMPRLRKTTLSDYATTIVETPAEAGEVGVRFDPYTRQAVAVISSDSREHQKWLDPQLGATHAALARLFKGRDVTIGSWSEDRTRYIVRVDGPSTPGSWHLYDSKRKEVSALGEEYPELKADQLGTKSFITYKARDGLTIPAYLHMPPGAAKTNLPLVVLPHGGPAARDDTDFDWWAQYFASQGYAVLQPQFRGSDGFGYEHRHAGKQQWGDKMQTDLVDGVTHLASQGVVDAKRVCIVGASYGGYAALRGMTAFPDTYRCGVSVNGVTDPGQFVVQLNRRFAVDPGGLREMFGNNAAQLAAASPAQHADQVKGPIMLIYSEQDTTVPPEQTTMMRERLERIGKPVEVVKLSGDDHHLMTSASRTQMLEATGAFLARNLPVTP